MTTDKFVKYYLRYAAKVTLCDMNGNIFYEGKAKNVPMELINNVELVSVEGMGDRKDLILTVKLY